MNMRRMKVLTIFLFFLFLVVLVLGWRFVVIQKEKNVALKFIKENLKQEFWPEDIEIKREKDVSSVFWVVDNITLTLLINKTENRYRLGIFIPEQKSLDPNVSKEIFSSYFVFSPEMFDCYAQGTRVGEVEILKVHLEEEAVLCRGVDERDIMIFSYKMLDSSGEGTYIDFSIKR